MCALKDIFVEGRDIHIWLSFYGHKSSTISAMGVKYGMEIGIKLFKITSKLKLQYLKVISDNFQVNNSTCISIRFGLSVCIIMNAIVKYAH
jgi:hypothetical protein